MIIQQQNAENAIQNIEEDIKLKSNLNTEENEFYFKR